MKRLIRVLSFCAGIAALIWAMRDRFISLALPREPQPPTFRHREDHPNVPHRPHPEDSAAPGPDSDDLTAIKGIGPVYAAKLTEMGIESFAALANASSAAIADRLDTAESRTASWIDQAKTRL